MSKPNLSELIASRICHDLISPVGAIANGVELLEMTKEIGPETDLIKGSAQNASARVRFFRIAFGSASADQSISAQEAHDILASHMPHRFRIDWTCFDDLPRAQVKLIYLAALCLETAMPRGGMINLTKGRTILVVGHADIMSQENENWDALANLPVKSEISATNVHFTVLKDTANSEGYKMDIQQSDHQISIRFS